MKKIFVLFIAVLVALPLVFTASADGGEVTYSGNSGQFIFSPGSEYSPTDLFNNFKGVMPGDMISESVTVKNDADNKVKVEIYMRSLGANEDCAEFLSELDLKVMKSDENEMAYMFDAAANETDGLTDWVLLGTLYSGGEVNLDLMLTVPVSLSNEFQNKAGYIDWEFMVKEYPTSPDDPKPPQTGDSSDLGIWSAIAVISALAMIIIAFWKKRRKKEE